MCITVYCIMNLQTKRVLEFDDQIVRDTHYKHILRDDEYNGVDSRKHWLYYDHTR